MESPGNQLVNNPVFACATLVTVYMHEYNPQHTPVCDRRLDVLQLSSSLGESGDVCICLELCGERGGHGGARCYESIADVYRRL